MNGKTTRRSFNGDADNNNCLFSVNEGIDKIRAIEEAGMLVSSVQEALTRAIGESRDVEVNEAFLLRESLLAVEALLEACQ